MEDQEFLDELRQMVAIRGSANALVDSLAFVAEIAERLGDDPIFGEYIETDYSSRDAQGRPMRVHGFSEIDDSDGSVSLVIGQWTDDDEPSTLVTSDVSRLQDQLASFLEASLSDGLSERIVESNPAYQLASRLSSMSEKLGLIRLHVISNRNLAKQVRRDFRATVGGLATETHIWDLARLKALYSSAREREAVDISLPEFGSNGIPCILASAAEDIKCYLCVIDGNLLADLFERYGSRLLEGNVRSFLGMKGGVNRGIRSTIQNERPLFFAFNNGIAATAASATIDFRNGVPYISGFSDLQIVNGGQTTANILRARKQDRLSLDAISIPMKLTVVSPERANELIPRIAEYANTQNKVAVADFFANHPFHRKMEEISRRLLVPSRSTGRVQSKWFYERARGQYQNERLYLSKARKAAHDLEYPPRQVINKTDLAKFDSVLSRRPHWVALGAQKNFMKFAGQFSPKSEKGEGEYWTELSPSFGDDYYKRIAGMAVLWKRGEEIVSSGKGLWYRGDYRPQIVAYSWALVFLAVERTGRDLSLLPAWELQEVDADLENVFRRAAAQVQEAILGLPAGYSNVGEWTKREACWIKVSELRLDVPKVLPRWSRDREEHRRGKVEERKRGIQDDGISSQRLVVTLAEQGFWRELAEWSRLTENVFGPDAELLSRAATIQGTLRIQNPKDWARLIDIRKRCEADGFRQRSPG